MIKYFKKRIEIKLVEFVKGESNPYVSFRPDGSAFVWSNHNHSEQNLEPGDFINITDLKDVYPVSKIKVAELYDKVDE